MGKKNPPRNSKATLIKLQEKAKEKYQEKLKVKEGETIEQWEKRTSNARMRYEEEFRKLEVRIASSSKKYKLSINRTVYNNRKSKLRWDRMNRVLYTISRREFKFFQNSMIILSWAEEKYGISRDKFLCFMYLYAEERPMTKEEIIYKLTLFRQKSCKKMFRSFVDDGYLKVVKHRTEQVGSVDTNLYALTHKVAEIIRYVHGAMVGTKSLNSFKGLRRNNPHVDEMFDKIKQEILEYRTGEIMQERLTDIKIEE